MSSRKLSQESVKLAEQLGLSSNDKSLSKNNILKQQLLKELQNLEKNHVKIAESYSQTASIIKLLDFTE